MQLKADWTRGKAIAECLEQMQLLASDMVGEFTVEHLEAAEGWNDRLDCLRWAVEARATVKEMIMWHRAQNGLDLFAE